MASKPAVTSYQLLTANTTDIPIVHFLSLHKYYNSFTSNKYAANTHIMYHVLEWPIKQYNEKSLASDGELFTNLFKCIPKQA